jgi:predicted DNA-binding transcriptional regulator AlpA
MSWSRSINWRVDRRGSGKKLPFAYFRDPALHQGAMEREPAIVALAKAKQRAIAAAADEECALPQRWGPGDALSGLSDGDVMVTAAKQQEVRAEDGAPSKLGPRRMLTEKQVLQIVPVSPVTLWRMVKRGEFPQPIFISPNKKFWFQDVVVAWQCELDERGSRGRRLRPARSKS